MRDTAIMMGVDESMGHARCVFMLSTTLQHKLLMTTSDDVVYWCLLVIAVAAWRCLCWAR